MKRVVLPEANRKDVEQDVPRQVRDEMEIVFVRTIPEALDAVFGRQIIWRRDSLLLESRL
jgi:ATP-dependent Lon protease